MFHEDVTDPSDKDSKEEKSSTPEEVKKAEATAPPKDETASKSTAKGQASEISPRALPGVEPPVYKPEASASEPAPTPNQNPSEEKSTTAKEDDLPVNEPLFEPEKKSNKKLFIIIALVLLLIIAALLLLFNYFNQNKKAQKQETESAQIQPETDETQMQVELKPAGDFDRSQVTLEILNGSGVAGAAKKLADQLEALGYSIIEVGNALERIDKTEILIAASLEGHKGKLLEDLGEDFKEATFAGSLEDSTASARIIIGKD